MQTICFVVEGKSDKQKLLRILPDSAIILCTNGTISEEDMLTLLEPFEQTHQYVTLFDADKNGQKLRDLMNRIYPEALQLIIPLQYKEVAETPTRIIRSMFKENKIKVIDRK